MDINKKHFKNSQSLVGVDTKNIFRSGVLYPQFLMAKLGSKQVFF